MEDKILAGDRSVLIVDRSEETREVLRTVLARRGVRTFWASRLSAGVQLARQEQPDLIVLDLELDDSEPEAICAPFAEQAERGTKCLVMLGSARRSAPALPRGEFVRKPYHYGPLIRRIEELLCLEEQPAARSA